MFKKLKIVCCVSQKAGLIRGTVHQLCSTIYSEQKNCPTKGQISLVRQIAAHITKVNPWKISLTEVGILFFVVPNNKHLAPFVDFILTLAWDPFDGTIFLHTIKLAPHTHTTWLNLKYYVNWPSTKYGTPWMQLYPQPMCPVEHSEISLLCF